MVPPMLAGITARRFVGHLFLATCVVFEARLAVASLSQDMLPQWALGPWSRPAHAQPVIRPNPESTFICPMRGTAVNWESRHTFNPAAVVKDNLVYVLYRAEDDSSIGGIGSFTSRVGLATSTDGTTFTADPQPVLFPAADEQRHHEWYGGCEDPRIAEGPDGTYVMLYTQYSRDGPKGTKVRLGLASSKDLRSWTKHGSPFENTKYQNLEIKSASIVHEVKDGRLIAVRVNGKYCMYFGEHAVNIAVSEDLIHWTILEEEGRPLAVMLPRKGYFDSALTEVGPQLVKSEAGIVLLYNGKNHDSEELADRGLPTGVYSVGQALFDSNDPTKLLSRLDHPFFKPELPWEKSGQYQDGTTFSEGLVLFKDRWLLYYGCADTFVGVAMSDRGARSSEL
eukprot:TRINITY_DN61495_c0_g1_i1.p1 TRINITY_DN61495_c0_g1~~TRINITY_DN61495_c0_g1_i1.p1  ORF type:complete len:395 (-),score=76.56 TRINITY_DN61495_c0_g1_i1:18-1202(-)